MKLKPNLFNITPSKTRVKHGQNQTTSIKSFNHEQQTLSPFTSMQGLEMYKNVMNQKLDLLKKKINTKKYVTTK